MAAAMTAPTSDLVLYVPRGEPRGAPPARVLRAWGARSHTEGPAKKQSGSLDDVT